MHVIFSGWSVNKWQQIKYNVDMAISSLFYSVGGFKTDFNWELVDPVVADPVWQDNDKGTIYKYIRQFPIEVHRGRGQNFPIFISCRYLVELGPRQLGLPVADSRNGKLSEGRLEGFSQARDLFRAIVQIGVSQTDGGKDQFKRLDSIMGGFAWQCGRDSNF